MMISCVLSQAVFVSAESNAVDYNDAPYAGVYAVTADKATTITTEIGSVTELAAGETGYMYLVKGANNVDITNGAALTITDLDDNGMDYLNQVNIPNSPVIFGQEDVVVLVDGDKAVLAHLTQDDGYRRTGIGQIGADVDGMHLVLLLRENIDGFKIIFNGFGYSHEIASCLRCRRIPALLTISLSYFA